MVLKADGPATPLLKHVLTTKNAKQLTDEDLRRIASHLSLSCAATSDGLIRTIAEHLHCDATECISNFRHQDEEDNVLLNDPFAEAVYNELVPEDKLEFKDFGDALKKKKVRTAKRKLSHNFAQRAVKRRRTHRSVGQGRSRAGQPLPGPPEPAPLQDRSKDRPPPPLPEAKLAPASQCAPAEPPPVRTHGPPVAGHVVRWEPVFCPRCRQVAGEYKYYETPGNRDGACWAMRCVVPGTSNMGLVAPYHRRIRTSKISEEGTHNWILQTSGCCRSAAASSSSRGPA